MMIEVSGDERDFILAGLRLYQRAIVAGAVPGEINDIATDGGQEEPTPQQIDSLCDRINH